jgi:hypothetical protein
LECVLELNESVKRKKKTFKSKCRIWRLKDADRQSSSSEQVDFRAMDRSREEDVESLWKWLKDCLLDAADQVCGRSKSPARHKETWWWNKETEEIVEKNKRLYKAWDKTRMDYDKNGLL